MEISLKVVTPDNVIQKRILTAMRDHLNKSLSGVQRKVKISAQNLLMSALSGSSETQSLLSGELRSELGIQNPSGEVDNIFNAIVNATEVVLKKVSIRGSHLHMNLILTAVPFDLNTIVAGAGTYSTEKGVAIDWFKWLTTLGDAVIVRQHESISGFPSTSRTGDKIMIKGRGWRVPPEFAGHAEDNFVTRAADSILPQLEASIQNIIGAAI